MSKIADIKGSSFTLSALRIFDSNTDAIRDFLLERVSQAPSLFSSAPIVIDVSQCTTLPCFDTLKSVIREAGMIPVGVSGCPRIHHEKISQAQLAVMTSAKQQAEVEKPLTPTKVIKTPVRSGQQVYAKDSDLVILNHVSPGAEVIADGSIHVYGNLKGRAIAGASGQQNATIFCRNLQAELISIAGCYWLSDKIEQAYWAQSVMIALNEQTLNIEPLAF